MTTMEYEEIEEEEEGEDESRRMAQSLTLDALTHMRQQANASLKEICGAQLPELSSDAPHASAYIHHPNWDVDIPMGPLFYPCCGTDTADAVRLFAPYASEFHFADAYRFASPRLNTRRKPEAAGASPKAHDVPSIGTIVLQEPATVALEFSGVRAYSHKKDGLLTLLEDLPTLSVFFYRGDSQGEGGSNQRWLEPVLLDVVLSRLMDGGILYTDGSNGAVNFSSVAPAEGQIPRLPGDPPLGTELRYRNRLLRCVFQRQGKSRWYPETAWQVKVTLE